MIDARETTGGIIFAVKAVPNAGKTGAVGVHNGMLKVKIAAQPERNKANEELIDYLSETLGVRKSQVEIIKGALARQKTVKITGITKQDIRKLEE
jgi:uncharacterized protein (TIGR00251 family)